VIEKIYKIENITGMETTQYGDHSGYRCDKEAIYISE